MKRALACVSLVVLSIFCFWVAISAINTPDPVHKGKAKDPTSADRASAAAGSITGAQSPILNSPEGLAVSNSTTDPLACQNKCQAGKVSCQRGCFQRYNVTNQTQYWDQCMQVCGTTLSVCGNSCIAGISLPPIATVLPPPTSPSSMEQHPAARPSPRLPIPQNEDSSSSQSQ